MSCLLVLPPHRGSGYTQLMIALSECILSTYIRLTQTHVVITRLQVFGAFVLFFGQ